MLLKSFFLLFFFFITVNSQSYDDQQQEGEGLSQQRQQQEQDQQQENEGSLPGSNAVDVSVPEPPSQIPETSFSCDGKPYDPGMYADEETGCRVFHLCYQERKESFICGTGTMFNQEILSCDYPANVDCSASPSFYSANEELGKAGQPEPSGDGGQKPTQQRPRGGARGGQASTTTTQQQGYDDQEPEQQRPAAAARPRPQAPRPRAQKPAPRARAPRPQAPQPRPAPARGKTRPRQPQIAQRQEEEAY